MKHALAARVRVGCLWLGLGCLWGCGSSAGRPPRAAGMEPRPEAGPALLSRINRARGRVGAPPLEPDAELGRAALDHVLGGDAQAAATPGEGGLTLAVTAHGSDVAVLLDGLLAAAASRSKLLNDDVTHAGIAVVSDQGELRVTVLVARLAPVADVARAPVHLRARLNDGRRARGVPELAADATLQAAADRAAARYFVPPLPDEQLLVAQVHAELEPFGLAYSRVEATVARVATVEEAARLEPAFDPEAVAVGVGVAQGRRPDHGGRVVAVVLVLAWPR